MVTIVCKDVKKTYMVGGQEIHALAGVDFEIKQGEFVVVVGPSGSGKTTLLNLLGGMDTPTSGDIMIGETNIAKYTARQLTEYRRRDVGFVFQFYNLMPNLTALENVELSVEISKHPLSPLEVLEQVGLADRSKNFPAQLSGGEQQRVSIARSVAKNSALILCDEPTGALDYETGKRILKLLHDISRTRTRTYNFSHTHTLKPKKAAAEWKRILGQTAAAEITATDGSIIAAQNQPITQIHVDTFRQNRITQITVTATPQTIILVTHNSALKDMADKVLFMKNGVINKMAINESPKPIEEIDW